MFITFFKTVHQCTNLFALLLVSLLFLLSACGSDGSGTPTTVTGTQQLGVPFYATYGRSVATDTNGNVYVAGETFDGLDGNTPIGTSDLFITKFNETGGKQFTKQFGVLGADTYGFSVTTDASGNVYVTGETQGGLDGNTLTGTRDSFITKYDSLGGYQFTRQFGALGGWTSGRSVVTDASGNVYVAGNTSGGLDGNTLTGTYDFFLTKYDNTGNHQFTKQLGVSGVSTYGFSAATDASGNVYVTGLTYGGLDGKMLTGIRDGFVTKYDSTGTKQFTYLLGVAGKITFGLSIATDAAGNVYVAGATSGGLDSNTLTGTYDFFVTKYDNTGVRQFTKQLGVAGADTQGRSITTDATGNVYVAGVTSGGLDGNTLTGIYDFFLTKYDSTGVKQFTKQLGVAGADTQGHSVATDGNGNVYVVGETNGGLDGNTLRGTVDFFITKYDSSGMKQ